MPQNTPTHPVDSTFHDCCNSIGRHAPQCEPDPSGLLANVPVPAGAMMVDDWMGPAADGSDDGVRYFTGTPRIVEFDNKAGGIEVTIAGTQYRDGRVDREIVIDRDFDSALTIDQARQLADAFATAADEVEQMAGNDPVSNDAARDALLTAHDHAIEAHGCAALAAAGLRGHRATRAIDLVEQFYLATETLGRLIDSLDDEPKVV